MNEIDNQTKQQVEHALSTIAAETNDTYGGLLEKVYAAHKPQISRTKVFVVGLIVGAILSFVLDIANLI